MKSMREDDDSRHLARRPLRSLLSFVLGGAALGFVGGFIRASGPETLQESLTSGGIAAAIAGTWFLVGGDIWCGGRGGPSGNRRTSRSV